jgi:hypothetical protein
VVSDEKLDESGRGDWRLVSAALVSSLFSFGEGNAIMRRRMGHVTVNRDELDGFCLRYVGCPVPLAGEALRRPFGLQDVIRQGNLFTIKRWPLLNPTFELVRTELTFLQMAEVIFCKQRWERGGGLKYCSVLK